MKGYRIFQRRGMFVAYKDGQKLRAFPNFVLAEQFIRECRAAEKWNLDQIKEGK